MPLPARQTEPDLLSKALSGDRLAWEGMLQRYGPLVYDLCRRLDVDPDDAYQEIWEKLIRALPGFDPGRGAKLSTWIATVAHRHLIDRYRRRSVRGEVVALGPMPGTMPSVPDRIAQAEQLRSLERAVDALPEMHRRIVVLHHLHDVPVDVLARAEGVPKGTVKSRLHRARVRLARAMGGGRDGT
jgi:RNA polymerase sigma-70 factor, ECF subfamily